MSDCCFLVRFDGLGFMAYGILFNPVYIHADQLCPMKAMEEVVDWEQERRGAKRVLEYLDHDSKQQNAKRRLHSLIYHL